MDIRLYLEGVRVPIRSVSVAGSESNHLQANIEIPPTPLSTSLKPRTLVHVIYKTSFDSSYKLLFEGELVGITASEDTQNKSTTLVCADLTNFWDYVWLYFLNKVSPSAYADTETASFASGVSPEARAQFSGISFTIPQSLLSNIVLSSFILAKSDVQRALLNILFLMANTSEGAVGNIRKPRLNQFLEKAFRNLRLGERVFVLPDNEIKRLIDFNFSQSLLGKAVGDLGNFASLTELINRFLGFVYYNWVPIIAPSYTKRNPDKTKSTLDFYNPLNYGKGTVDGGLTATTSSIADARTLDKKNVLRSVVFKPKTYFLPPPTCNFLFPSMFDHFSSSRMFLQEPTRLRVQVHPIPGNTPEINTWNTASYYAPTELGDIIRDTERNSGSQQQSYQERGTDTTKSVSAADAKTARSQGQAPQPAEAPTLRFEKLIQQTGSGDIDETMTGVVPAFEDLGWAEYATLALDNPVTKTPQSTLENSETTAQVQVSKIASREKTSSKELDQTAEKYLSNIAQYKLDVRRYTPRALQGIRGPFNPNLVIGFPGIVFTKRAIFVGEIASLNQIASAAGQAYTAATLGMARELSMVPGLYRSNAIELEIIDAALRQLAVNSAKDNNKATFGEFKKLVTEEFKSRADADSNVGTNQDRLNNLITGFDPVDRIPTQPEWLSSKYRPENIGEQVYRELFGPNVKSLLEVIDHNYAVTLVTKNMVIAANLFLIRYLLAPDKVIFVNKLTQRNIATAKEAMHDFLGFTKGPSENLSDGKREFSPDNLSKFPELNSETKDTKPLVQETIKAPDLPINPTRLKAVENYVGFLTGAEGKAFRG